MKPPVLLLNEAIGGKQREHHVRRTLREFKPGEKISSFVEGCIPSQVKKSRCTTAAVSKSAA